MIPMYTLVGSAKNRSARPLWLLEEIGLPFSHIPANAGSPEARAHSPNGKLPVLITEGQTISDSTAIMTYLADKHGCCTAPAGSLARAAQDSMTQFLLDEFDALLWTAARHSFVLPEEHRLPAIKDSLRWEYGRSLTRLADRLQGPCLMGADFTLPDIIATHCLGWGAMINFGTPEGALAKYFAAQRARPAFIRAMAR